jgi:cold shock CspA family protein
MMPTGTVRLWREREDGAAFGFIRPDNANDSDVYFDRRGMVDKNAWTPQRGDRVTFGRGRHGKYAKYVELLAGEIEMHNEGADDVS